MTALEGITRCFLLAERGDTTVRGIVVRGVQVRLPGTQRPLAHIRTTSQTTSLHENVGETNDETFRDIEPAVHPFQ